MCAGITTLGIRPGIDDYSTEEKHLLRSAERVFFPTPRFAYLFSALQIPTFPRHSTYRFQHSRVLQEILLAHLAMAHPRTRLFFGNKQKAGILNAFSFPIHAAGPLAAVHDKRLVEDATALEECCHRYNPLIVQEVLDWSQSLRVLCVHSDCVGGLWRNGPPGPDDDYEPVPLEEPGMQEVFRSSLSLIHKVQLDDMVLEWGYSDGQWQLIEMKRPPVRWPMAGGILNRHDYICQLVQSGRL